MFNRMKSALRSLHLPTVAELERDYLNQSANIVDLEFRQRQIDQGLFRRHGHI